MAKAQEYVHVVYQGRKEGVFVFGIAFGKGVPVLVTKAIAETMLDPEWIEPGFALYDPPQPEVDRVRVEGEWFDRKPAPVEPAPAAPVESTTDQPEPKEA